MLLLRMNRILLSVLTIKMLLLLCYLCMSCLVAFASRFWGGCYYFCTFELVLNIQMKLPSIHKYLSYIKKSKII